MTTKAAPKRAVKKKSAKKTTKKATPKKAPKKSSEPTLQELQEKHLEAIEEQRSVIRMLEGDVDDAKETLKAKKSRLTAAIDELNGLIDEGPAQRKLFTDDQTVPAKASEKKATPKKAAKKTRTTREILIGAGKDGWADRDCIEMTAHGVSEVVVDALTEVGITTLGQVKLEIDGNQQGWADGIEGVSGIHAMQIGNALAEIIKQSHK